MAHCKSSLSKSPRSKLTWMASRIIRVKGCHFMPLKAGTHISLTLYMPPVLFYQSDTIWRQCKVLKDCVFWPNQVFLFPKATNLQHQFIHPLSIPAYLGWGACVFQYFKWSLGEGLGAPPRIHQSIRKAHNENTHIHRENMQTRWRKTSGLDSNSATMYNNKTITNIFSLDWASLLVTINNILYVGLFQCTPYMFVHCVRSHSVCGLNSPSIWTEHWYLFRKQRDFYSIQ